MRCEDVQEELQAYLQGTLSATQRTAVENHLSTCEACAEEATAMKDMGELLTRRLKDWVDGGTCPPDLALQIEQSIRGSVHHRSWWQRWPAMVGAVAAVAAVLVITVAGRPEAMERMASVPLLGALAAQLISPDLVVQVDPARPDLAGLLRPTRTVDLNLTVERDGAKLTVQRIDLDRDRKLMRVQFRIKGIDLALGKDHSQYQPILEGPSGAVDLHSFTVDKRGSEVLFDAYFDAVTEGERLMLKVPPLPVEDGSPQGPWEASFTN